MNSENLEAGSKRPPDVEGDPIKRLCGVNLAMSKPGSHVGEVLIGPPLLF